MKAILIGALAFAVGMALFIAILGRAPEKKEGAPVLSSSREMHDIGFNTGVAVGWIAESLRRHTNFDDFKAHCDAIRDMGAEQLATNLSRVNTVR